MAGDAELTLDEHADSSTEPPSEIPEAAIRADGLRARLSRQRSIGPFTFNVEADECVALVGANGSGKTTAIRIALGLIRADSGLATVFGEPVSPVRPPRMSGYVPDHSEFWEWEPPIGNLLPFAPNEDSAESALDAVGLSYAIRTPVRKFSRGMKQRLAIARGIVADPALLVLDEPSIALDAAGTDLLVDLIRARTRVGRATLVATHDRPFLARLDARTVRLADGATLSASTG